MQVRPTADFLKHAILDLVNVEQIATEHDLLDLLTERAEFHGQRWVATELGYSSASTVNGVLHGTRGISAEMAKKMGWERMVIYVRRDKT